MVLNETRFFIEHLTNPDLQAKFFSGRKVEIKHMVEKIRSGSMPFVLENKIDSEMPYILENLTNELMGKEGQNISNNKSVPVVIDCGKVNIDKIEQAAFSELIRDIHDDGRLFDIRKQVKESVKDYPFPESLQIHKETAKLIKSCGLPNTDLGQYAKGIKDILEDGQIIFILYNLDKIKNEDERIKLVEKWHNGMQKTPSIATIYAGNEGLDNYLKAANGFYAHAPEKIGSIKKEDLKDILDNRIKKLSEDKYSGINDFLGEDVWELIRQADYGENIEWTLETLNEIIERYMQNKKDISIPIKYEDIKKQINELIDMKLPIDNRYSPIIDKIINIYKNSMERLLSDNDLTNKDWKTLGVDRLLESEVGNKTVGDLPQAVQTRGALLGELESKGLLKSKTIERTKYYLPGGYLMLKMEMQRKNKTEKVK